MHYVEGLPCQEIAALLGRTTGAVRVRLHRARGELREALGARHPAPDTPGAASPPRKEQRAMIEVTLEDVVVRVAVGGGDVPRLTAPLRIVLLRERGGAGRLLPIWVGAPEGDALALHRGGAATPRPLTIDLTIRLLDAAGAAVERVVVSSLRENVFYAVVGLRAGDVVHELDARPSDAFNLAVRAGAPIYVASEILETSGIVSEDVFGALDEERARHDLPTEDEPSEWRSLTPAIAFGAHERK